MNFHNAFVCNTGKVIEWIHYRELLSCSFSYRCVDTKGFNLNICIKHVNIYKYKWKHFLVKSEGICFLDQFILYEKRLFRATILNMKFYPVLTEVAHTRNVEFSSEAP
jgi:hypothetical protein